MTDLTTDPAVALADPATHRFWTEERVRFADLDALGHVNNNAIGVYFEQLRLGLMEACGGLRDDDPWTIVLARSLIEFKAEIRYPATVRLGLRVLRVGNTSVRVGAGVFLGDLCVATQDAVCVVVDKAAHRPTAVPAGLRDALARY